MSPHSNSFTMSHVTTQNESFHYSRHEWVISLFTSFWVVTWLIVIHRMLNSEMTYSCHHSIWVVTWLIVNELLWVMSPLISLFGMRHVTFQSESCDTSDLVMSHFKMSHAIIQTESCHSVECIMSPFRMSRVTIQNASCLPFRISHVTLQKKSCHPSEWVT